MRWGHILGLSLMLVLSPVTAPQAATVLALSLDSLIERADAVVSGHAIRTRTHRNAKGQIVRSIAYHVDSYIVGKGSKEVVVRLQGGSLNGIGRIVPGEVDLDLDKETVLFLTKIPNESGPVFVIVGMAQGKFNVIQDPDTSARFIARTLTDLHLVGDPGRDVFDLGRANTSTFIPYDDFVRAVQHRAQR
ncbi:MAG: hypothetical protein QNJ97_12165 [Myxococcota bacterium]|nr:hypothetical protein [Myxococcota bacterium]